MSRLQEHAENLRKKLERLEFEVAAINKTIEATAEKLSSQKSRVEKNILDFSGREIAITV